MLDGGTTHRAIVVGAGVAGLAAAGALARKGCATALVDDGYLGGLVLNVGVLDGAGDAAGQSGADLVNVMLGEALEAGADYRMGAVTALEAEGGRWRLPELGLAADAVVLATGARLRRLGAPGETALTGRGVSQCAFCDGGLYRGKDVLVIGGGDAAFQEALHLAALCASVGMLLRGRAPRAREEYRRRAEACPNLSIRTGVTVQAIVGEEGVDGVRVRDAAADADEFLTTAAIFPFVGLAPETALAPAALARDGAGALVVDGAMRTGAAGLYAIAAARSGHAGGIADALADAEIAAEAIASS